MEISGLQIIMQAQSLGLIDKNGKYLESLIVKLFMNNINTTQLNTIKAQIMMLIKKYNVDIVSIGNGTASRERN